jgi:hypothetical protein
MRTLAILAVVVLAGRPASAASILIDSIDSTGLLPVELLLASSRLDVPDADSDADEDALSAIALRLVPHAIGAAGGEATLDAGDAIAAASDDVWSGYRPVVTSEVVHAIHGGGLVSPYTIEPVANTESLAGLAVDTPGATSLGDLHALPSGDTQERSVDRAAMSQVEPAALTLLAVCLTLAVSGAREWRRRTWHRRHLHYRHLHRRR